MSGTKPFVSVVLSIFTTIGVHRYMLRSRSGEIVHKRHRKKGISDDGIPDLKACHSVWTTCIHWDSL